MISTDGFSAMTANKSHELRIDSSHIENDIDIFQISCDLKTVFLCDSVSKIHVLPAADARSAGGSKRSPRDVISKLNPFRRRDSASSTNSNVAFDALNLYFLDVPIETIHVTLLILIVCQSDDSHLYISYFDVASLKLKITFRYF